MENKKEKAVLAGLSATSLPEDERATETSMQELAALVETAGGEAVAYLLQNKATPEARTFIGEGKVKEMKELVDNYGCDFAVFFFYYAENNFYLRSGDGIDLRFDYYPVFKL